MPRRATFAGGCHCRTVRFEVDVEDADRLVCWRCNCSVCEMKQNTHFVVAKKSFRVVQGQEALTRYQFGTRTAEHLFCEKCGVQSFYRPRSNPDGVAVTVYCLDRWSLAGADRGFTVEERTFDGRNWEASFRETGIAACSAPPSTRDGASFLHDHPQRTGSAGRTSSPAQSVVAACRLASEAVVEGRSAATKVVHFLRHGEGHHNTAEDRLKRSLLDAGMEPRAAQQRAYDAYEDEAWADADLTDEGVRQARTAGQRLASSACADADRCPQLWIASPLVRTLRTLTECRDTFLEAATQRMAREGLDAATTASARARLARAPVVACEAAREALGMKRPAKEDPDGPLVWSTLGHPCNRRRPATECARMFPAVDFSGVEHNTDALYDGGETEAELRARLRAVMTRVRDAPARTVVVVSHSLALHALFDALPWAPESAAAKCTNARHVGCGCPRNYFKRGELRTLQVTFSPP
jgi:broad specificity phosphatase PhoE